MNTQGLWDHCGEMLANLKGKKHKKDKKQQKAHMYHEDLQGMQMLYHAAGVTNVVREDVILLVVNRRMSEATASLKTDLFWSRQSGWTQAVVVVAGRWVVTGLVEPPPIWGYPVHWKPKDLNLTSCHCKQLLRGTLGAQRVTWDIVIFRGRMAPVNKFAISPEHPNIIYQIQLRILYKLDKK